MATGPRAPRLGFEQRLLRRFRAWSAHERGWSTLIVGFSAGPDSLALAAALARIADRLALRPLLVHVDHALRPESASDADRAAELAREIGLPFELHRLPRPPLEAHPGAGVEEAARRERFRVLAEVGGHHGFAPVVLGHHQGDQAETVLLHLVRGAGLRGAAGMAALTTLDVPWWGEPARPTVPLTLLRPLLDEPRAAIADYLAQRGLHPVADPSNAFAGYRRNVVRGELLPVMERISPGATAALARYAAIAAEEDATLDGIAGDALLAGGATADALPISALADPAPAIAARMARLWLALAHPRFVPTLERTEALIALALSAREGPIVELGEGLCATVLGDALVAGTRERLMREAWSRFAGPRAPDGVTLPVALRPDESVQLGSLVLLLRRRPAGATAPGLAAAAARDRLHVRSVREGDRFAGGTTVRDWLRRHRVPVLLRRDVLCVASDAGVLLVPGTPVPPALRASHGEETLALSWVEPGKGSG